MKLGDVNVVGDVGATLDVETTFEVASVDQLTSFTKVRWLYDVFRLGSKNSTGTVDRGILPMGDQW